MVYSKFNVSSYYWLNDSEGQANTINDALHEAEDQVRTQYPYAVHRDRQDITRFAEQIYQTWQSSLRPEGKSWSRGVGKSYESGYDTRERDRWDKQQPEQKRLYVSTFVGKYLEELAKKDEAARPKVQPQPQLVPLPAAPPPTPSNVAMLQGAKITLKSVEHYADECVYLLKVDDPNYIDGGYEQEWVVPLGEATILDTTTPSASSSFGAGSSTPARGYASSSAAYEATSKTPQKPRKPLGGYFRKP